MRRHPELLEGAAAANAAQAVLDRRHDPGAVDHHVPAAAAVAPRRPRSADQVDPTSLRQRRAGPGCGRRRSPWPRRPAVPAAPSSGPSCRRRRSGSARPAAAAAGRSRGWRTTAARSARPAPGRPRRGAGARCAPAPPSARRWTRWSAPPRPRSSSRTGCSGPCVQNEHSPQVRVGSTDTRSPGVNSVTSRADRLDHPGRLVARNDREDGRRELAVQHVQVGPAQAHGLDPDQHVPRPGDRDRAPPAGRRRRAARRRSPASYFTAPMARPRTRRFCAIQPADDHRQHRDRGGGRQHGEELTATVDEAAQERRRRAGHHCGQQVGQEVLVPGEDEADQRRGCRTRCDDRQRDPPQFTAVASRRRSGRPRPPPEEPRRRTSASSTPRAAG